MKDTGIGSKDIEMGRVETITHDKVNGGSTEGVKETEIGI